MSHDQNARKAQVGCYSRYYCDLHSFDFQNARLPFQNARLPFQNKPF